MSRIENETKKVINDFYDSKLRKINDEIITIRNKIREEKINEVENNEIYKDIKEDFELLRLRFPNISFRTDLDIRTYDSTFEYENSKEYKKKNEEYMKTLNEKRKLILTLENCAKNSNDYKIAIEEFMKKVGK